MSILHTRVGNWSMKWKTIPRGMEGSAWVEVTWVGTGAEAVTGAGTATGAKTRAGGGAIAHTMQVSWRRDPDGIRLVLPQGVHGFDLQGQRDDEGRTFFDVTKRGSHLEWGMVPFAYGDRETQTNQRSGSKKAIRVRAQMPGKILRVMVTPGQNVEKGQSIILMEAMKMENEIRALQAGKVSQVKVVEGQAVETGADLVLFEA